MPQDREPGDVFLNRYMPNATHEEREQARQNLYDFFAVLLRIATRRMNEDHEREIRANADLALDSESGSSPLP
jgi:hypothetical protein